MLSRKVFLIAAILTKASILVHAQETAPPVYFGPYLQASAAQFSGEWTRSDGTYKLLISEKAGELEVAYLNPEPINVESSNVEKVEEALVMRIVLRDEGYPGSVYELEYLPQYRVLVGYYTIPGQQPSEVFFTR